MGEKRAVQVSHELWRQMMTQGYTSAGVRCIEGIPEDARLVQSFAREEQFTTGEDGRVEMRSDPVFVFESDNWSTPTPEHTVVNMVREVIPVFSPVFRVAECQTCKLCEIAFPLRAAGVENCLCLWLEKYTKRDFGCTKYEPRETND